ncbi:DUF4426 domain-containing protein [Wenzhouxiangella sp. AB-CW3]|uniref:DUF4426 domain-containing protein n=1 Tax=Wenzhouxiangella sp. AB-CW3 TaxID=2771012 RepID=UPI00168BA2F0|nr:DUF4426 domain-containing protein [Wenzhouxiangella sp. AB-CW3]QOC22422.1 DUF4426 domain-containing protein [Wenzhouxiangella sp. AB-CW3]
MMPKRLTLTGVIAALTLLVPGTPALAEQSQSFERHVVHYNTLITAQLPAEVARAHDIQRSSSRALLNIAVLEKPEDEADMPSAVTAEVTASAVNRAGQRRNISMREVTEQDAIYYIGTFRVHDEENLDFTVRITPSHSEAAPYELRFEQEFFVD